MSLKIVLLTTDTTHHRYYAWKLTERFPLQAIFIETMQVTSKFETFHPFEALRDAYEREVLLAECPRSLAECAPTRVVGSVNDPESLDALCALAPDVVIVFGTGRLLEPAIRTARLACLNLHGGNPEYYRGLDTHLWAIYQDDFGNLMTTLHHVDRGLDTGDIVLQERLPLTKRCRLHELRSINTQLCVELSLQALASLESTGSAPSRQQERYGRYYSFMPAPLKEECVKKFERHVERL